MGKTSSKVKDRYNEKAYDRITIRVYKGQQDCIKARAASLGESVNGYICRLIAQDMGKAPAPERAEEE